MAKWIDALHAQLRTFQHSRKRGDVSEQPSRFPNTSQSAHEATAKATTSVAVPFAYVAGSSSTSLRCFLLDEL